MESIKTHFGSVCANDERNEKFSVEYFLLKSIFEDEKAIYGLEVLKKNSEGAVVDEIKIVDLTCVEEIAQRFLNQIIKGLVTPVTVFDVIEDFLGVEYGI